MLPASLLVALGPRAVLSASGIVTLVAGVWHADRTWDEKGSQAYARASREAQVGDGGPVVIPPRELDAAFPFPWAFVVGWVLYAVSYLFPTSGAAVVEVTTPGLVAAAASLALAVIASVPMGDAVRYRKAGKKKALGLAFVASWVVLTVATGLSTGNGALSLGPCALGAALIVASMKILWAARKMGDSWEQHGRPNPNPVVYNLGGPLFVLGWFLFWIGMAATPGPSPAAAAAAMGGWGFLPVFLTARTALAFETGAGMVIVVYFVDYAHDEGAEYVGFGTDGRFFGRFLESTLPFLLAWAGFGLASFLTLSGGVAAGTREYLILGNCIAQGIDAGVLIQTALYKGDMAAKNRWSVPFVLLFAALALNLGLGAGGWALLLSLPGAALVVAGQKTVFGDRKRGDQWMVTKKVNPNPVVYSLGEPLFMAGWILLSLAMALPADLPARWG